MIYNDIPSSEGSKNPSFLFIKLCHFYKDTRYVPNHIIRKIDQIAVKYNFNQIYASIT